MKLKKINLWLNRVVGAVGSLCWIHLLTWCLPCKLDSVWGNPEIEEEITEKFDPSENLQKASTQLSQVMKHQCLVLFYLLNQFCAFPCWASPPSPAMQLRTSAFEVPERCMETFSPVWLGSGWLHCLLLWLKICIWENTKFNKIFWAPRIIILTCFQWMEKLSVRFVGLVFFLIVSVISLAFIVFLCQTLKNK